MVMATEPDILNVWSPTCLKAKIYLRILNHFDVNNKKKTRNIIKKAKKKSSMIHFGTVLVGLSSIIIWEPFFL